MLAAISEGTSIIKNLSDGEDVHSTRRALEQLGIKTESLDSGKIKVHGRGGKFSPSLNAIDCGNSGTTMRLLAGLLGAQPFSSRLIGDASLSRRPMERIITPLRQMGVALQSEGKNQSPPLVVGGRKRTLSPIHDYTLPVASAQLKSSLLLAALTAKGMSTIIEPIPTRDHTERLFESFGVSFNETKMGSSKKISLIGPQKLQACNLGIPGDLSSAAFWIVAAAARAGSTLHIENLNLNPTRTGFFDVLKRMGASIEMGSHSERMRIFVQSPGTASKYTFSGTDPFGDIVVEGSSLRGTIMEGKEIPGLIDELPILAVAGALAKGTTIIRDARELRVKETDRITALVYNLRAMGVVVQEYDDGLEIKGGSRLQGTSLKSFGDHRIAMAFSIAALFAEGPSTIDDVTCITTSYPGFPIALHKIMNQKI